MHPHKCCVWCAGGAAAISGKWCFQMDRNSVPGISAGRLRSARVVEKTFDMKGIVTCSGICGKTSCPICIVSTFLISNNEADLDGLMILYFLS